MFPARQHRPRGRGREEHGHRSHAWSDTDGVYRKRGPARVFGSEERAIAAIKSRGPDAVKPGDVMVVAGCGPMGTGMEEIYQVTAALKHIPWGKEVARHHRRPLLGPVDRRLHRPRLARGTGWRADRPSPRRRHRRDCHRPPYARGDHRSRRRARTRYAAPSWGSGELENRPRNPDIAPHPKLPDDTRLWAALQEVGGGTWGGCVYDVDAILTALDAGRKTRGEQHDPLPND